MILFIKISEYTGMHLNTDQLLSFIALVQTGSVSAAAERRHLTQPAISNQLKRLQETIGTPLYHRHGRGIRVTANGEALFRHALKIRDALAETEAFAEGLRGLATGRIHVAASQTVAGSLLPAALVRFQKGNPGIEVFIDSGNSLQVIEKLEAIDLGLIEGPLTGIATPCTITPLGQDEIVAVLPPAHPLLRFRAIPLQELIRYPLIWREAGSGTRKILEQALMAHLGHLPEAHLLLGGVAAVMEAARQGLGTGIVSRLSLRSDESGLQSRPLKPALHRPMSLLLPAHASPLAKRFAAFLVPELQARLDGQGAPANTGHRSELQGPGRGSPLTE